VSEPAADASTPDPLAELSVWIEEAREAKAPHPAATAFITVGAGGKPSARTVTLKRIEPDSLLFSSALWTRKAQEIEANPQVALLFHWPSLGRQVHVTGEAAVTDRALAEELWAERDPGHRRQTLVSRQGEEIESLDPLRDLLDHQNAIEEAPPPCPPDWGALRIYPTALEFWRESPDRLHQRRLFSREPDGWTLSLLAP
jgi:pyridoxamine 5'-phosphate oxidase